LSKLLCRLCVQWTNDVISGLLYNSEYFFDVECVLDRQKHSANVTLTTPGCSILIDDSFKRCSLIGPPLAGALTSRRVLRLVDSRRRDTAGVGRRAVYVCVRVFRGAEASEPWVTDQRDVCDSSRQASVQAVRLDQLEVTSDQRGSTSLAFSDRSDQRQTKSTGVHWRDWRRLQATWSTCQPAIRHQGTAPHRTAVTADRLSWSGASISV